MASPIPGTSKSSNARVCSGVRSVGVSPVPPVVSTTRAPSATAAEMAAPTGGPSGTTTGGPTVNSRECRKSTRIGPVWSSYTPAAARLEATTTAAGTCTTSSVTSSPGPLAGAAADLGLDPDVGDDRPLVDGLD